MQLFRPVNYSVDFLLSFICVKGSLFSKVFESFPALVPFLGSNVAALLNGGLLLGVRLIHRVSFRLELFDLLISSSCSLCFRLVFLGFNSSSLGVFLFLSFVLCCGKILEFLSISGTALSLSLQLLGCKLFNSFLRVRSFFEESIVTELLSFQSSLSLFRCQVIELLEFISNLLGSLSIFCRLFLESRNRVLICDGSLTLSRVLFGFDGGFFGVFVLLGFGNALGFCKVPLLVSCACCF